LEKINADLRLAEKQGDQAAAKFMREQCRNILAEINQLAAN
jgi:hypothetical protein